VLSKAAHLDHYIRGRTWLSPTFAREKVDQMGKGLDNCMNLPPKVVRWLTDSLVSFSEADILRFKNEPEFYEKFRKGTTTDAPTAHRPI
jgi:hypothetical protein